jgi:hypothetical protein
MTTLEQLSEGSATPQEAGTPVQTAFLVVLHPNGQWSAHAEYEELDFVPQRKAHMDDFVSGAANITVSVQVQQAAMHTLIQMNQQAQAMQAQIESQKIAQGLDLSQLRKK